MMRLPTIVPAMMLASLSALSSVSPSAAQQIAIDAFPASAIIRGENIWVRADPEAATEILTYFNRGDAITITGESARADGEEYFPVEVDATGESGWVRDLFIDPESLVSVLTLEEPARDRPTRRDRAAEEPEEPEEIEPPRETRPAREDRAARGADQGRARDREEGAVTSEVLTFSGSTATVTEPFAVPSDVLTVSGTHDGAANFVVETVSEDGVEALLFNEIGAFNGQTTLEADPSSTLILDVQADGPWEIVIEPAF